MAEIDLTNFGENGFVIRFGSEEHGININTYTRVLTSLSRAIKAINKKVDENYKLDIIVIKEKPGCFLVHLKPVWKYGKPLAKDLWRTVIAPLFVLYLFHKAFPDATIIDFSSNQVIVVMHEEEETTINISDEAKKHYNSVMVDAAVDRNITNAARAIHSDKFIDELDIHDGLEDTDPVLKLSESDLHKISSVDKGVEIAEQEVVSVHKSIFEHSSRKWEFMWNGNKISASISDDEFFERMKERSFSIKQDEKFIATIEMHKEYDKISKKWKIKEYRITKLDGYKDEQK